ncbi:MAG: tetratricopeptide repeat protein, partial [Polyangiaceae bacterium]|nr:tetratricopeptide repeat protein [Polyangiaceae bacterium]
MAGEEARVARHVVSPPKPPTPQQVQALEVLQREAARYGEDARDYRDAITGIVKQYYDQRRRRVLSGLDREIATEQRALDESRNEAIRRLEDFISRYSGAHADTKATPDAMFRLAALYDEKARATLAVDISDGLKPAIALYRRIIRQFPEYEETAGVYYYLGHALFDSDRLDEGQQVWRSLVCHNHFPYPVEADRNDPDRDLVGALPQDHDEDYWTGWRHRYPAPESLSGAEKLRWRRVQTPAEGQETTYVNPFPDTCKPVPQPDKAGEDQRYLAEVWWKIGDWYFDETDPKAGPYSFNRAVTAFRNSMKSSDKEKGVLYGVSMYKLAWTRFKQQRYRAATQQFVELLKHTDEV